MRVVSPDRFLVNADGLYEWSPSRATDAWDQAYVMFRRALEEAGQVRPRAMLLVGVPGSGKTTFLEDRRGSFWEAELGRTDVVFDATLTSRLARRPLVEMAQMAGARIEAVVFDVPLVVALQRNASRAPERRVPYDTVARMYRQLETEPPTLVEGLWRVTAFGEHAG